VDRVKREYQIANLGKNFSLGILLFSCILSLIAGAAFADNQPEFIYDAAGKRNPFIALITPDGRLLKLDSVKTGTGLVLEGVIFDQGGDSFALINGKVIKVGDTVGDYTVLGIDKNRVSLFKAGQLYVLETKKEER